MSVFVVPVKTPSLANSREHWAAKAERAKRHKAAVAYRWQGYEGEPRLVVRITRISPRKLDDDNLRGALKSIRDGVAARLRIDDASPLVRWEYGQERGEAGEEAVRVEVSPC